MSKLNLQRILSLGALLIIENWLLHLLTDHLPELIGYPLKTIALALSFYLLAHRRYRLTIPLKTNVSIWEQVRINWLSFVYMFLIALPLTFYGLSNHTNQLPQAIIISACAAFFEEYLCRGILIQIGLGEEKKSYPKILQLALLTSLIFGLAHLGNLTQQPLDVTLYQVYYASALGLYFVAITIRTRTLWWAIIIHFIIDFASILASDSTVASAVPTIGSFFLWLFVALLALFLTRPKKLKDYIP